MNYQPTLADRLAAAEDTIRLYEDHYRRHQDQFSCQLHRIAYLEWELDRKEGVIQREQGKKGDMFDELQRAKWEITKLQQELHSERQKRSKAEQKEDHVKQESDGDIKMEDDVFIRKEEQ